MHLDEPSWWYAQAPSRLATLLQPLGAIYGRVATARYWRATPYRSRLPVICIGNFTAGGTGKTPLAIHLCEALKAAGHAPAALTRGYGGRLSGPYWVNATTDVARDVGDEALLLARAAPTLVARDRRLGARAIEIGPHPVTVIVMDDGLQNPALAKDLAIAVVDGGRGVGNGLVMPAGPLRAPLDFQLELTDVIVVNESAGSPAGAGPVTDWLRHRFAGPVLRASVVPAEAADWLQGARVVAWAGIGAPQRFFATLRALGADVADAVALPRSSPARRGRRPAADRPGAAAFGHAGDDAEGHGPARRRPRPVRRTQGSHAGAARAARPRGGGCRAPDVAGRLRPADAARMIGSNARCRPGSSRGRLRRRYRSRYR